MPLNYRSMKRDGDRPRIENSKHGLGVVVNGEGGQSRADITALGGFVMPGTGGMSVAPSWRDLPSHRIPKRLATLAASDAGGRNDLVCWCMGDGPFAAGPVSGLLTLRPDKPDHGTVEPIDPMTLHRYRAALADTQSSWRIDEA